MYTRFFLITLTLARSPFAVISSYVALIPGDFILIIGVLSDYLCRICILRLR